jgi:hypothetical protein
VTRTVIAVIAFLGCTELAFAQNGPIFQTESFEAWEGGGFLQKTWKELGTPEAAAIIAVGCALFEVDCSSVSTRIAEGAKATNRYIQSGNYVGTAFIGRHPGEDYYAKFGAPATYTPCKAVTDVSGGSITGPSTFNASIQADGIGIYAVVPKNRPSGQWARFNMLVEYVPNGSREQYKCWPMNAVVVQCTGQNCNTPQPGSRH